MKLKKLLAISMAVLMLCTMTALSAAAQTEEVTTEPADLEEILVVKFSENYAFGSYHHLFYQLSESIQTDIDWTFCYEVMLPDDTQIGGMGTLNPANSSNDGDDSKAYRNLFVKDQWGDEVRIADIEGWTAHPGTNLVPVAHKKWYSRELPLNNYTHNIDRIYFCVENPHTYLDDTGVPSAAETGMAFFKNICIKDGEGNVVWQMDLSADAIEAANLLYRFGTYMSSQGVPAPLVELIPGLYDANDPYSYTVAVVEDEDTDDLSTDAPATDAPATDAPATDAATSVGTAAASGEAEESKGGCGGAIAFAPVALIAVLGGAALSMKKR